MIRKTAARLWVLSALALFILKPGNAGAFGEDSVGTSGAQFLKLGTNARAVAMGEAYSAVSDGSDSIYWNPAGLDGVDRKAFSLMHAVYFQSISYDFASYAQRIGEAGVFAAGFQYLNPGSIGRTDRFGSEIGSYSPYDVAVSFGWARKFADFSNEEEFTFGASAKYIRSKVVETAAGGAMDAGVTWTPRAVDDLNVAFALQNMGSSLKFKNESDSLPFNIKFGSAYKISYEWTVAADLNFPNDAALYGSIGTEYRIEMSENFTLAGRAGFKSKTVSQISGLSSISAGAGLQWKNYGLDTSWQPFGALGNSYLISISGKF